MKQLLMLCALMTQSAYAHAEIRELADTVKSILQDQSFSDGYESQSYQTMFRTCGIFHIDVEIVREDSKFLGTWYIEQKLEQIEMKWISPEKEQVLTVQDYGPNWFRAQNEDMIWSCEFEEKRICHVHRVDVPTRQRFESISKR